MKMEKKAQDQYGGILLAACVAGGHRSRIRYLSKKKFANFNEFSEIKKIRKKKSLNARRGRGLPTTTEEYDAFHGFMLIKI